MINCPYCVNPAELVGGLVIYPHRPDLAGLKFWQCAPCDAYVGCHKPGNGYGDGTAPLGRLANAELRAAKQRAHALFDPIWKSGRVKRRQAYKWLARELGVPFERCHIGEFDVDECKRVVLVCLRGRP